MTARGHCIALLALAAALLVAGVACSDDDSATPEVTTATTAGLPAVSTTEAPAAEEVEPASWEQVAAPPECVCSDGSPYHYWIRRADPERVVFFLEGGGVCFSAETCGPTSPTFTRNLAGRADVAAGGPADAGIFDLSDERNPFADWSFVFVPYCTGDLHLGNATHDYGDGVVVQHNGAVNAKTALAATAAAFPDATVTLLADGSGAYPDDEGITTAIGSLWGVFADLPDWPEQTGPPPGDWTLPRLHVQAGRHVPDMRVATVTGAVRSTTTRSTGGSCTTGWPTSWRARTSTTSAAPRAGRRRSAGHQVDGVGVDAQGHDLPDRPPGAGQDLEGRTG